MWVWYLWWHGFCSAWVKVFPINYVEVTVVNERFRIIKYKYQIQVIFEVSNNQVGCLYVFFSFVTS
jgi:hypothetical protein